jgi:hypothetical protein
MQTLEIVFSPTLQQLAMDYFTQDNKGTAFPFYVCVEVFNKKGEHKKDEGVFLTPQGYEQHMELNAHNYYTPVRMGVRYFYRNPQAILLVQMLFEVFKTIATPEQIAWVRSKTNIFNNQ